MEMSINPNSKKKRMKQLSWFESGIQNDTEYKHLRKVSIMKL